VWNLLRNEEVLCEIRSGNEDFVLAPGCTPVLSAERHLRSIPRGTADCEIKNGGNAGAGAVTRAQVLRSVDILHFS